MTSSLEKTQIVIQPSYLMQLSEIVETLSHFYQQQKLPSLSANYRNVLVQSFSSLHQSLQLYSNSVDGSSMISAAIIKCKAELQIYCLDKVAYLLKTETEQLGTIVQKIMEGYKNNIINFEKVLLSERQKRITATEHEKDTTIEKLREQLMHRKQYIAELRTRLEEVETDNMKMYQDKVENAKNISDRALSLSPKKNNSTIMGASLSKTKIEAMMNTAHKTLSAKQTAQTIIDIMDTKQKQETVKGKKTSLKNFLKTYFRYKFGMKDLANETELNFKQAVEYFRQTHQKSIFILFTKMYSEDCEEQYYWEHKSFNDNLTRIIKRYLNQKDKRVSLDDLERLYDSKVDERSDILLNERDVQYILINTYKTSQVHSLQLILNEILIPKIQNISNSLDSVTVNKNSEQILIPSKKLINEILNYELSRHLSKVEDIVRSIKDVDIDSRGELNLEEFQTVIARLKIPDDKIDSNMELISQFYGRFITYSEAIEAIEKIRKSKFKKSDKIK